MARHFAAGLAVLAAISALAAGAPPCAQVAQMITPCMAFLADRTFVPYGACCIGVTALNRTAPTRQDRVAVCDCIKSVAPRFPAVDAARASALPRMCGVTLNFTISSSTDCSTITAG